MAVVLHEPKRLTAWSPEVHPAWPRTSRVCVKVSCAPPDASVDPIGSPRVAAVGWQWLPYDSPSASGTGTPARRGNCRLLCTEGSGSLHGAGNDGSVGCTRPCHILRKCSTPWLTGCLLPNLCRNLDNGFRRIRQAPAAQGVHGPV